MKLRSSPVDAPDAHALLAEYFQIRTEGFAVQGVTYRTTFPDPAAFVPPAGVFVVLDDDEGAGWRHEGRRIGEGRPIGDPLVGESFGADPEVLGEEVVGVGRVGGGGAESHHASSVGVCRGRKARLLAGPPPRMEA